MKARILNDGGYVFFDSFLYQGEKLEIGDIVEALPWTPDGKLLGVDIVITDETGEDRLLYFSLLNKEVEVVEE